MLAGVLMTEQNLDNAGNLWVWPGTHRTHAALFRERGPEAFLEYKGYPKIALPEPIQVLGQPGDLVLAHYLLGHNIGGNYESERVRRAVYFRLRGVGHQYRWRECLCDELLEFDPVRIALIENPMPKLNQSYVCGDTVIPLIDETIGVHFDKVVARWPDSEALVVRHQGIHWTFSELQKQVDDFAAGCLRSG
jgi:hypothetical protein